MISKDLKKISRSELVDIIYQMKKNEQQLQEKISALQEELQDKRIRLSKAGSIAEAAVSIANVFSAAQTSADLYLQEIACMKEETERECKKMIEDANKSVEKTLADGEKLLAEMDDRYQAAYKKLRMVQKKIRLLEEQGKGISNEG